MRSAIVLVALFSVAYASRHFWENPKSPLETEFEWKYFDYEWKSPKQRDDFIKNGWYNPKAMVSIDVDRSADGRTFLTIIRDKGVLASLHTISFKRSESGPLLVPYPDWSWYKNPTACNAKRIVGPYRVAIDACNRLWVLDTGYLGQNYTCPAQLLTFDLRTNKMTQKTEIPRDPFQDSKRISLLITPVVKLGKTCNDVTVYMADVTSRALLVWKNGFITERIKERVFRPEEKYSNYTIAGESFFLDDGLFGMALTPPIYNREHPQMLYFKALASRSIYATRTQNLDKYRREDGLKVDRKGINYLPSQGTAMAFSSRGTLFYGLTQEIGIGCWNLQKPFEPQYFNIALKDTERLQFISGLKIIKGPSKFAHSYPHIFREPEEYLLMSSNRLQKVYAGTQDFREINFRITKIPINRITQIQGLHSCV